jgi:hypothetical protein
MEEHCIPKKALQPTIHRKRRVGKPRKRWEDGVTDNAITLLVTRVGKTTPKIENPGGNILRKLRLDLVCDTFVAAADTEMVTDKFGSTNILYPSVKCASALT